MSFIGQFINWALFKHPKDMRETYWEHMRHALAISVYMLMGSCAAFVHAVIPALFTETASGIARQVATGVLRRTPSKP